ncbi:hypothetical protein NQ317_013916 [Molorchus minor]|uniref:Ionotropic receptor n=1 Tax=Molorchus minor TaxID=1323400 RepID=A0ABQ9K5Y8_9CUCU|nr:hypothetical protein NQ317_013916 [Molorchus minor]
MVLLKSLFKSGHQSQILPVTIQNLNFPIPPNHQIFVLNLQCENSSKLLNEVNDLKYFASPFRWILYNEHNTSFKQSLDNLNILIDSDVTLCEVQVNRSVLLKKVYKRHPQRPLEVERMGYWTKQVGIMDYGFEKIHVEEEKSNGKNKHIDSITKVNYVLVEHLKDIINATLKYSVRSTWGYKNNNSEWSGMMGELIRKEADIGGTALFFISDRVDIIDYVAMTTPTKSKFVFRQPKLSYVSNVFTLPFDRRVWVSTICLAIIIGIVELIIVKWEWKQRQKYTNSNIQPSVPEIKGSVTDIAILTFGAFCQQGSAAIPFSLSGRIATIILYISFMFLYTSYSANIVALLQSSSNSIKTLEDLLKSRIQVGVDDTVFNRFYFPNSTEPIRRALYLQKVAPKGKKDHFMPLEEGVRKMWGGLFAFHMETGPGYKVVSETFQEADKCGLQEIQFLQVVDPYLAIQKNASYKRNH